MVFGEREKVWLGGDLIGVDTGAYLFGVLSAVELPARRVFSVREEGADPVAARQSAEAFFEWRGRRKGRS
jgi:hypothetical protein